MEQDQELGIDAQRLTKSQARAARRAAKAKASGQSAPLKPRSPTQRDYLVRLDRGESIFATGPAGTGKTYLPARIAARNLNEGRISKIILCRVTASDPRHKQGFLPGRLEQKLAPWLVPVFDGIKAEVGTATLEKWRQTGQIEIASFEHLRGRTFDDCFVLFDEAQNATFQDLKTFLTRIGENCQVVVTGDLDQIDIRDSGLEPVMVIGRRAGVPMSEIVFGVEDVVRSAFTKAWVRAFAVDSDSNVGFLDGSPAFLQNAISPRSSKS